MKMLLLFPSLLFKMCQFQPNWEHTHFATEPRFIDKDGLPKWVETAFATTKGGQRRDPKTFFRLTRNYVDQRFCPVLYLSLWAATSRLQGGPLFPRLGKSKSRPVVAVPFSSFVDPKTNIKHWRDAAGNNAGLTYKMLHSRLKTLFTRAGFSAADPYTIRKSATKWAARCGAEQFQVVAAGRWEEFSRHFLAYIQAGVFEGQDSAESPENDPIRKLWVFYPTAIMQSIVRDF